MRRLRSSFVRILAMTAAVVGAVTVPAFGSYPGGVGRIAFGIAGPGQRQPVFRPAQRSLAATTDRRPVQRSVPGLLARWPPDRVL